jgi:hypothetical protein
MLTWTNEYCTEIKWDWHRLFNIEIDKITGIRRDMDGDHV